MHHVASYIRQMKALSFGFLAFFISLGGLNAQTIVVKPEKCKKSEINIISGEAIPANYAIIGASNFPRKGVAWKLDRLDVSTQKAIREFGKLKGACTIFVDFKSDIMPIQDDDGRDMKKTHIYFYALRPYSSL